MAMTFARLSPRLQEVHVTVAHSNRAASFSTESMYVVFVEIRPEFYPVDVVIHTADNGGTGNRRKAVIVWIFPNLSKLDAAQDLVVVCLLRVTIASGFCHVA